MAYTGWVDVSKNGSPTTLHRDRHPDYVLLTLKERQEMRADIVSKFGTLTAFCKENPCLSVPQLVRLFTEGCRIKPSNLQKIRTALENASVKK